MPWSQVATSAATHTQGSTEPPQKLLLAPLLDDQASIDTSTAPASPASSSTAPVPSALAATATPNSLASAQSMPSTPATRSSERCWFRISEEEDDEEAIEALLRGSQCQRDVCGTVTLEKMLPSDEESSQRLSNARSQDTATAHQGSRQGVARAQEEQREEHPVSRQVAESSSSAVVEQMRSRLLTCTRLLRELQAENSSLSESLNREHVQRCSAVEEASVLGRECEELRTESAALRLENEALQRDSVASQEQRDKEKASNEAELLRAHTALVVIVPELEKKLEEQRNLAAVAEAARAAAEASAEAYRKQLEEIVSVAALQKAQAKLQDDQEIGTRTSSGPEKLAAKLAAAFGGSRQNVGVPVVGDTSDAGHDVTRTPPVAG